MSNIRKIGILLGITGLVLAMASVTGFAATIKIDECILDNSKNCTGRFTDGPPDVDVNQNSIPAGSPGHFTLLPTFPQSTPEGTVVKGTLTTTFTDFVTPGGNQIALTEGPINPVISRQISDTITFFAGTNLSGAVLCQSTDTTCSQAIEIDFLSDTETVLAFTGNIFKVENGNVQTLTCNSNVASDCTTHEMDLKTSLLTIKARSEIPEPASLLLLGSGLAGLGLWRRRMHS